MPTGLFSSSFSLFVGNKAVFCRLVSKILNFKSTTMHSVKTPFTSEVLAPCSQDVSCILGWKTQEFSFCISLFIQNSK